MLFQKGAGSYDGGRLGTVFGERTRKSWLSRLSTPRRSFILSALREYKDHASTSAKVARGS